MSREITNVLSTGLDIYSCILCVFVIVAAVFQSNRPNRMCRMYFITLAAIILVSNLCDISNWMFEGLTPAWHVPALHIMTFIYYAVVPFIFYFMLRYLEEYISPKTISIWIRHSAILVCLIYIVLVCITPFTGLFYKITEDNIYVRGDYNFISLIFYGIFYLTDIGLVAMNSWVMTTKTSLAFFSFALFPIFGVVLQMFFYGFNFVNVAMTLSLLMMYMFTYHRDENRDGKDDDKNYDRKKTWRQILLQK